MKYKIVRSGEKEELERKVNRLIKKGWKAIGGVSVCGGYGHAHFHQAMVKEGEDASED